MKTQICDICKGECGQRRSVAALYLVDEKQIDLCHPCHDELRFVVTRAENPFLQSALEAGKIAAKDWYFAKGQLTSMSEVTDETSS